MRRSSLARVDRSSCTYLRSLRAVKAPPEVVQLLIPHRLLSVVAFQREAPGSFELLEIQRACHLFRESAAALETLSITRVRATLPFLVALIPLFPNLRELSISWMGFISTGPGWSPPDLPLHNTDDDELSDPEEDVPIDVVSSAWASKPSILHEIIRWILQRQVTLPQNIEIFRLPTYGMLTTPVQKEEQCKAIAGLAHMYASLREIQLTDKRSAAPDALPRGFRVGICASWVKSAGVEGPAAAFAAFVGWERLRRLDVIISVSRSEPRFVTFLFEGSGFIGGISRGLQDIVKRAQKGKGRAARNKKRKRTASDAGEGGATGAAAQNNRGMNDEAEQGSGEGDESGEPA
ncbi:hypothetical protein B0H11DRAFT_2250153 [Mycena galericulata]|nr:hypothetical protein B0H11DRAFT_2250153 [Mycena galericulata]